jgi:hypothetical protein
MGFVPINQKTYSQIKSDLTIIEPLYSVDALRDYDTSEMKQIRAQLAKMRTEEGKGSTGVGTKGKSSKKN